MSDYDTTRIQSKGRDSANGGKKTIRKRKSSKSEGEVKTIALSKKRKDLTGIRYGKLVVITPEPDRKDSSFEKRTFWNCICDCGSACVIRTDQLTRSVAQSCGCLQLDTVTIHGYATDRRGVTRTWRTWASMNSRCNNRNDPSFGRYGGRGIKICERWCAFENFLSDMGERPVGKTIDRKDNDGDYTPDNCKWSTPSEQANNRRRNRILVVKGVAQTASNWAKATGISVNVVFNRIRAGWSDERVVSEPVRSAKK